MSSPFRARTSACRRSSPRAFPWAFMLLPLRGETRMARHQVAPALPGILMARLILGVTGSVAAIRTPALFGALSAAGHYVRIVATKPSLYFFDPDEIAAAGHAFDALS